MGSLLVKTYCSESGELGRVNLSTNSNRISSTVPEPKCKRRSSAEMAPACNVSVDA